MDVVAFRKEMRESDHLVIIVSKSQVKEKRNKIEKNNYKVGKDKKRNCAIKRLRYAL